MTWKTEAINFNEDFRWLDDDVYQKEYDDLEKHDRRKNLILVNLEDNPNQLIEVLKSV